MVISQATESEKGHIWTFQRFLWDIKHQNAKEKENRDNYLHIFTHIFTINQSPN